MSRDLIPDRGRPGQTLLLTVERELTSADLFRLATEPDLPRAVVPGIKRLKPSHHAMARYIAAGKTYVETAHLVGATAQRIGDLDRHDPAFQELVAYYKEQIDEISVADAQRVQLKLLDAAETAVDEINDRLDDPKKRGEIPIGELRQVVQMGADRTVAPPKTAQPTVVVPTVVTFNIGTKDIRPKDAPIIDQPPEQSK